MAMNGDIVHVRYICRDEEGNMLMTRQIARSQSALRSVVARKTLLRTSCTQCHEHSLRMRVNGKLMMYLKDQSAALSVRTQKHSPETCIS